jgi:hypothetical protein
MKKNAKKAALFGILFVVLVFIGAFTKLYFLIYVGIASLFIFFYLGSKVGDEMDEVANNNFLKVLKENNFTPDKKVFSHDQLFGLAINEANKQIAYVSRNTVHDEYKFKLFNFQDIIEAKVKTNHETITSTSIGSIVSRGIVGGLVAGGIGSIIAGVTSKQNSSQKIKELTLEFVVDDILNPRYTLSFYKSDYPLKQSSDLIELTETWYRIFSVIINRNSQEARSV